MAEKKSILTTAGAKKLQDELMMRKVERRAEIKQKLKEARAQGDLSENAEYDAAKDEQGVNEDRISELESILKNAVIVDEATDETTVFIGAKVVVRDPEFGDEETFVIVGSNEADSLNNKVSHDSPVGRALLGAKVGDQVTVNAPGGDFIYEILSFSRAE